MGSIRDVVLERIWRGSDPLKGFPVNLIAADLSGWNSHHPYLREAVVTLRPSIIVEVGVWKGGSTIFMADQLLRDGMDAVVIAVDTWLGSSEHRMSPEFFESITFLHGYPALYYTFAANVIRTGLAEQVVPLPLDSLNAARLLQLTRISAGVIHLDAGHDYDSVMADLRAWWPVLAPGGLLIGDDYAPEGPWESVRRAFDDFFAEQGIHGFEHRDGKCRVQKPLTDA